MSMPFRTLVALVMPLAIDPIIIACREHQLLHLRTTEVASLT